MMRIAISAQSDDIDSLVDPRFGRAAWLIFIDSESGSLAAMPNAENADSSGAAGTRAAEHIVAGNAEAVITGNVGPGAHGLLAAAGVRIFRGGNGVTVREALARLGADDLDPIDAPTVAGHWSRPAPRKKPATISTRKDPRSED
jgi:predicted Fe-Mo cluster-binding NifX family protein